MKTHVAPMSEEAVLLTVAAVVGFVVVFAPIAAGAGIATWAYRRRKERL